MSRTVRCAAAGAVLAASVGALTACDSGTKATTPAPGPSGSASAGASTGTKGAGTATVTIASTAKKFSITCTRTGNTVQAAGNEGNDAVTLTVAGTPLSAVLVTHGVDGSTTIYQAIAGLHDDGGKAVGAVSVSADADKYSGSGTFVLSKIDAKGKRVKLTSATSAAGTFDLSCAGGYAAVPTASASATASTPAATPKPTASASS